MNTPLKVAVVSKMDRHGGGASRVAEILVHALRARNHEATLHTILPCEERQHHHAVFPRPLSRLLGLHQRISQRVLGAVVAPIELPFLAPRLLAADIVHFQDTWSAISPATIAWTARRRPTLYTFHDCSPFTGYCLYPGPCDRFQIGCGQCPQRATSRLHIDASRPCQAWKKRMFRQAPLTALAPSAWMARMAEASGVFSSVQVLPNNVDETRFLAGRRLEARARLGLTPDAPVIILAASSFSDTRKGTPHALAALSRVATRLPARTTVLLLGGGAESVAAQIPIPSRALGYLRDESAIADAWAAADLYLFPTLADNLPNTILESMASGTAVLAFASGGVPEMIAHDRTGWLAPPGDVDALSSLLEQALASRERLLAIGLEASRATHQNFGTESFVQRHLDAYENRRRDHAQF